MRNKITDKNLYLNRLFSDEDSILKSIRKSAEEEGVFSMQISFYEGKLLQFFCRALKVKKVVEIGTLYGYSSLMMARALPKTGVVLTLDNNKERHKKAKHLVNLDPDGKKIQFITGPALKSLKQLENKGPFDMVFIDADKAGYLGYLKWAYKNLKKGGLVAGDNTFLFGALYGKAQEKSSKKALKVMQGFNKEIVSSGLYIPALIPTEEGLTLGIKK